MSYFYSVRVLRGKIMVLLLMFIMSSSTVRQSSVLEQGIKQMKREMTWVTASATQPYDYLISSWVTNKEYKLYLAWLQKVYVDYPEIQYYASPHPKVPEDSPIPASYFLCYWLHPSYDDLPVLGLSWEQAMWYSRWRTDRLNEWLLVENHWMEPYENQLNEHNFNLEAWLNYQYEPPWTKKSKESDIIKWVQSQKMPYGWYVPGFRLPTQAEAQQPVTVQTGKPKMSDEVWLDKLMNCQKTNYWYLPDHTHYFSDGLPDNCPFYQGLKPYSFIEKKEVPYFSSVLKNYPTLALQTGADNYHRLALTPESFPLWQQYQETAIDSFAQSPVGKRIPDLLKKLPKAEWIFEPASATGTLACLSKASGQPFGYQGLLDQQGLLDIKDSLGRASYRIIGFDEQKQPIQIPPFTLPKKSADAKAAMATKQILFTQNGTQEKRTCSSDSNHYLVRFRMVNTPFPLPQSQTRCP